MEMLTTLKLLKNDLAGNGFIIDGVVGSYAYGDYTDESDIDILYHLEQKFLHNYGGFSAFKKLTEIKAFLVKELQKNVDLIPSNNLSKTAKESMLSKVLSV
jgi:predicted nucleotidyltransferase